METFTLFRKSGAENSKRIVLAPATANSQGSPCSTGPLGQQGGQPEDPGLPRGVAGLLHGPRRPRALRRRAQLHVRRRRQDEQELLHEVPWSPPGRPIFARSHGNLCMHGVKSDIPAAIVGIWVVKTKCWADLAARAQLECKAACCHVADLGAFCRKK